MNRAIPGLGREQLLFENVGFGEVVTAGVPADAALFTYRAGEPGLGEGFGSPAFIGSEDLGSDIEAGVPLTVVLTYAQPLRDDDLAGAMDVFYDAGDYVAGGMPARPVEGALVVADVSPAGRVLGEANEGFKFGIPGAGCLRPAGRTRVRAHLFHGPVR